MEYPTRPGGGDPLASAVESLRGAREFVVSTFTATLERVTARGRVLAEELAAEDPTLTERVSQGLGAVKGALRNGLAQVERPLGQVIDALAAGSTVAAHGGDSDATGKASAAQWSAPSSPRLADETDPVVLDLRERLFVQGDREARAAWGCQLMEQTELGSPQDRLLERVLGSSGVQIS